MHRPINFAFGLDGTIYHLVRKSDWYSDARIAVAQISKVRDG